MANTQYIVKEGERWDAISQKAYGNPTLYSNIIAANPLVPITPQLPGGTVLNIPILTDNLIPTDTTALPPWKR